MTGEGAAARADGLDIDHLRGWIGRSSLAHDVVSARMVAEFRAMLDLPAAEEAEPAPPAIHWCLAPQVARARDLGSDGHPARGGFLPPVPLPRRMWAGGTLELFDPFRVGDRVERRSRIADVTAKTGRTGSLCFVAVEHDYGTTRGPALRERHDIVYRPIAPASARPPAPAPPGPEPAHRREVEADPVLLFRYSALTFNGHRIHYDRAYASGQELYPGLVVHGPLQVTLLLDLATELAGRRPSHFAFRAVAPLFDGAAFSLNAGALADRFELWVADAAGQRTMAATATFGPQR